MAPEVTEAEAFIRVLILHFELLGISAPKTLAFSISPLRDVQNTKSELNKRLVCQTLSDYGLNKIAF